MFSGLTEKFLKWVKRNGDPLADAVPSDRITTDFYDGCLGKGILIRAYAEKTWCGLWDVRLTSYYSGDASGYCAAWADAALNEGSSFMDSGLMTLQAIGILARYEKSLRRDGSAVRRGPVDEMKLKDAIALLRACDVDMSRVPYINPSLK